MPQVTQIKRQTSDQSMLDVATYVDGLREAARKSGSKVLLDSVTNTDASVLALQPNRATVSIDSFFGTNGLSLHWERGHLARHWRLE